MNRESQIIGQDGKSYHPAVNFSPMSSKFVGPHIVENRGIRMEKIFLRLISWKSPPKLIKIFAKLDFFTNVFSCFVFYCFSCFLHKVSDTEENCYFVFERGKKCEFEIEWGGLFHDINIKNNGATVIPQLSTICG